MRITSENVAQIRALSDELYDLWLDLDSMQHDTNARQLVMPLSLYRGPVVASLILTGVIAVDIKDTERIGVYNILKVRFDQNRCQFILVGNIPLTICVTLDNAFVIELATFTNLGEKREPRRSSRFSIKRLLETLFGARQR